ncbi:hypothetical protein [Spiroplasma endosymbiont of Labia minor]|uniref:hypothetical protein n=1 Tax=Spiroplasma endosymbiont of Labia minor TaxID=3066305 RepID=UPI0030D2DAA3
MVKGKVLKVCNECKLIEISLRLKKLYRGPNIKIMKHIEELMGIIDTQSKTISKLILDKNIDKPKTVKVEMIEEWDL